MSLGISDFHNLICVATKMCKPNKIRRQIAYRSYKHFNEVMYLHDLECAPFHVSHIFTDIDDQYWFYNTMLKDIIDQHAPIKHRTVKAKQLPYMNNKLRKATNVKGHLRRRFNAMKTTSTWRNYRDQRNLVTKLKRESFKHYFDKECRQQANTNQTFWNAVKPFISNKGYAQSQDITLFESNEVVADRYQMCNLFNVHFVNVASGLCEPDEIPCLSVADVIDNYSEHPGIKLVKEQSIGNHEFSFNPVTPDSVLLKLKKLNVKKTHGYDFIPAKLLKLGAAAIYGSLTPIINASIQLSMYPNDAKKAEISPMFKKNDPL